MVLNQHIKSQWYLTNRYNSQWYLTNRYKKKWYLTNTHKKQWYLTKKCNNQCYWNIKCWGHVFHIGTVGTLWGGSNNAIYWQWKQSTMLYNNAIMLRVDILASIWKDPMIKGLSKKKRGINLNYWNNVFSWLNVKYLR